MTDRHGERGRAELERQLRPTPNCIPLERFGQAFTEAERDHLAACARCQAELALWQCYVDLKPVPSEDAAAAWIAAALRRRPASPTGSVVTKPTRRLTRLVPRTRLLAAASVLLVAAVGYVAWNPEPRVSPPAGDQIYRAASVQVVTPTGNLEAAPKEFRWVAVDGAVRYDVRVLEIDGTTLWTASSSGPRIDVPAAVSSQFAAGKTISWDVTAHNSSGASVAVSGTQRFRVKTNQPSRRE